MVDRPRSSMSDGRVPLDGLDLNLLVTLRELLLHASVTRAADALGQSQPAVSRALATLRAAFGDPILVRAGRGMVLSQFAETLRTPLEQAMAAVDRLPSAGAFDPNRDRRVFRIILPDVISSGVLATLAVRLAEYPSLRLQVFGTEGQALRALLDQEYDLHVGAPRLDHPELRYQTLEATGGWSIVYGPKHPAWDDGPLGLEGWLRSEHLQLTPEGRPRGFSPLDRRLAQMGHPPRAIRLQVSYISAVPELLKETPYIASLPTHCAAWVAAATGLKFEPHPFDQMPRLPLRLSWHVTRDRDPAHRWLRALVAEVVDGHLAQS